MRPRSSGPRGRRRRCRASGPPGPIPDDGATCRGWSLPARSSAHRHADTSVRWEAEQPLVGPSRGRCRRHRRCPGWRRSSFTQPSLIRPEVQEAVDGQAARSDEQDAQQAASQGERELDATLGVPEAPRQLDLEDDDRGVAKQRGGRDGRQEPDR